MNHLINQALDLEEIIKKIITIYNKQIKSLFFKKFKLMA